MINFKKIAENITLPKDLQIRIEKHPDADREYFQIFQTTTCNRTGEPYKNGGRKWDISQYMTESEFVLSVWKAVLTFEEHELREQFLYEGKRILDPHINVRALLSICEQLDVRK